MKLRSLAHQGIHIVALPEMHDLPYWPILPRTDYSDSDLHNQLCSTSYLTTIQTIAREQSQVVIVPTLMPAPQANESRHEATRMFANVSYVIDADGTLLGHYCKTHIPEDPGFYEQQYFVRGQNLDVFATRFGTIAPLICFDQWFPEAAREVSLKGADLILYATALGTIDGYEHENEHWQDAWEAVQRGHAIANGVHVAATNRIGREGGSSFFGGSFSYDAFGNLLAHADSNEQILISELDFAMNRQIQEGWGFLRWRNPHAYTQLNKEPQRD